MAEISSNNVVRRRKAMCTICCFCIPMRGGCFIVGYLNLIFIIKYILNLWVELMDRLSNDGANHPKLSLRIGFTIVYLLFNILCLYGLHKRHPEPIHVYVVFVSFVFLLVLAVCLYVVITSTQSGQIIAAIIIGLALKLYFIFMYYNYAVQLEIDLEEAEGALPQ